jgi:hypothetical protein
MLHLRISAISQNFVTNHPLHFLKEWIQAQRHKESRFSKNIRTFKRSQVSKQFPILSSLLASLPTSFLKDANIQENVRGTGSRTFFICFSMFHSFPRFYHIKSGKTKSFAESRHKHAIGKSPWTWFIRHLNFCLCFLTGEEMNSFWRCNVWKYFTSMEIARNEQEDTPRPNAEPII